MAASQASNSFIVSRSKLHELLVIASPILIVLLGTLVARAFVAWWGDWAWVGAMPVYWLSMSAVVLMFSGWKKVLGWYRKPRGGWFWPVLAVLVGLSAFPLLLIPNASLLRQPLLAVLWFLFALINGNAEEIFWRGFLLNEMPNWPKWLAVGYSSVLFIIVHFTMLGAFSASLFNIPFLVILTFLTAILVLLYLRTGSLRWPVLTHVLADWGNMNIFVFMNLIKMF
jgi:uncharacterized protein